GHAIQASGPTVLDLRRVRVDADDARVARVLQRVEQVTRTAADHEDRRGLVRREMREIVGPVVRLELLKARVDVLGRLPIRVERLESRREILRANSCGDAVHGKNLDDRAHELSDSLRAGPIDVFAMNSIAKVHSPLSQRLKPKRIPTLERACSRGTEQLAISAGRPLEPPSILRPPRSPLRQS